MKLNEEAIEKESEQIAMIKEEVPVKAAPEKEKSVKKSGYKERIFEWKKAFGNIYKTTVSGQEYVWRKIKRSEYTSIMVDVENEDPEERYYRRQEEVTKVTVLYPDNIEELVEINGGLASVLSSEVLNKSGFEVAPVTDEL